MRVFDTDADDGSTAVAREASAQSSAEDSISTADPTGGMVVDLEALAARFERFAEQECGTSPLYRAISLGIRDRQELLELASMGRAGQQVPNLFLGAVHLVLSAHVEHELAAYYPSLGGDRRPDAYLMDLLSDFCGRHRAPIAERVRTGLVQTNEVRRSAVLRAGLSAIADDGPVALIEVGASAGLNLLFDRYRVTLGSVSVGPMDAAVTSWASTRSEMERNVLGRWHSSMAMALGWSGSMEPIDSIRSAGVDGREGHGYHHRYG